MSATFHKIDRSKVGQLLGITNPTIIHGHLYRRGTNFQCVFSGNPSSSTRSSCKSNLQEDDSHQAVLYSNSETNTERSLMEMATSLLEVNQKSGGPTTITESLTGGDGIKRNVYHGGGYKLH